MDEYAAGLDEDRRYLFSTYRFVDMARKVVGVGSVGTRSCRVPSVGRDGQDPLVLQAKEAQGVGSKLYLGSSAYANHGERVVRGSVSSQAASDIFGAGRAAWALTGTSMTSTFANFDEAIARFSMAATPR